MATEGELRTAAIATLRVRMLHEPVFSRDDLAALPVLGQHLRLTPTQSGIWKPSGFRAALSIVTGYYPDASRRPYADGMGTDGLLRYKWRGLDPQHPDNRALRWAMLDAVPLIWFVGVAHRPGTNTQLFQPVLPVWIMGEEPAQHQFVVALEADQLALLDRGPTISEVERRYNETVVRQRLHQPVFRSMVLQAYQRRCAVCRLPFEQLLDAAHISADADGGVAAVRNGLALCKIHHGAFDADILGIRPDYVVTVKDSVLETFDGPTLQHTLKEVHGASLAVVPSRRFDRPDRDLLDARYERYLTTG